MIAQGGIGMTDGYAVKTGIPAELCSCKQQLEVEHIVDDDRVIPFIPVMIPGADHSGRWVKPRAQCTRRLQEHSAHLRITGKAVSQSIAAIQLKSHIVCTAIPFLLFQLLCIMYCLFFPACFS